MGFEGGVYGWSTDKKIEKLCAAMSRVQRVRRGSDYCLHYMETLKPIRTLLKRELIWLAYARTTTGFFRK